MHVTNLPQPTAAFVHALQVQRILKCKGDKVGQREMLIRWVGFGPAQDSWVHEKDVSRKAVVVEYDGEYVNITV